MRIPPKVLTLYRRVKAVDTNKVTASGATKAYVGKLRITAKTNNTTLTEIKLNNSKANEIDYSTVSTTLNNNSWEVINQVCIDGRALEFWQYGDYKLDNDGNKWLFIDATPNRYPLMTGGYSQAAFMRQNVLPTEGALYTGQATEDGYATSHGRDYLNSLRFPTDIFKLTLKNYLALPNSKGTNPSGIVWSQNVVFVPSAKELGGTLSSWFDDGTTAFSGISFVGRVADKDYWTRTLAYSSGVGIYAISFLPSGNWENTTLPNSSYFRPCFVLGAPKNKTAWTLPSSINLLGTSLSLALSANDYIEIDRLKKKVYLYKNGVVTDITSGTWRETVKAYDGTSTGLTRSNRIDSMLNMVMTDNVQIETKANNDVELTLEYITGVSQ